MSTPLQSSSSIPCKPNNNLPTQTYRSHSNVYQYPLDHEQENEFQQLQNPPSMTRNSQNSHNNQNIHSPVFAFIPTSFRRLIKNNRPPDIFLANFFIIPVKLKQNEINRIKQSHPFNRPVEIIKVQRNSQQQSIQIIQNDLKQKYQHVIKQLQTKIQILERKVQQEKRKYNKLKDDVNNMNEQSSVNRDTMLSHLHNNKNTSNSTSKSKDNLLSDSTIRVPRLTKANSSKQFPSTSTRNQRSSIKKLPPHQSRQSAISIQPTQQFSQNHQQGLNMLEYDLYKFQKTFLLSYLLRQEEKDEKLIEELNQIVQNNNQGNLDSSYYQQTSLLSSKSFSDKSMKSFEKIIDQMFKQHNKKLKEYENKYKDQKQIIKIHQLLVIQLNQKINQYDGTLKTFIRTFSQLCQQIFKNDNQSTNTSYFSHIHHTNDYPQSMNPLSHFSSPFCHPNFPTTQSFISSFNPDPIPLTLSHSIQKSQQSLKFSIKKHKHFVKQKFISCQNENKQLKRILDDMIKLIKSNKRINIGGITNTMRIKQG